MAGKLSAHTSLRLFRVLDSLSKNTWIEFAVDRARAEIGEGASDEAIANHLAEQLGPVLRFRGDSQANFGFLFAKYDTLELKYMSRNQANRKYEEEMAP